MAIQLCFPAGSISQSVVKAPVYVMLKHTALRWNGSFENWFWNKLKAGHLKGSPLSWAVLLPGLLNRTQPPTFQTTGSWGGHVSRIPPVAWSHLWARPPTPALAPAPPPQCPWLYDPTPVSASGLSARVKTHFFTLSTCHRTHSTLPAALIAANTYCVHSRRSLSQSQLPGDPLPQLPAHRTQDTVATMI